MRLLDLTDAPRVVSVRDAILCLLGYTLAKELLRALIAASHPPH